MKLLIILPILFLIGCATRVPTPRDYKIAFNTLNASMVSVDYEFEKCPKNWTFPKKISFKESSMGDDLGKYFHRNKNQNHELEYGEYDKSQLPINQIRSYVQIKHTKGNKCIVNSKVGLDILVIIPGNPFAGDKDKYIREFDFNKKKSKLEKSYKHLENVMNKIAKINKIKIKKVNPLNKVSIIPFKGTPYDFTPSMDNKEAMKNAYLNIAILNNAYGLTGNCQKQCELPKKGQKESKEESELTNKVVEKTIKYLSPEVIISHLIKELDNPKDLELLEKAYFSVVTPDYVQYRWAQLYSIKDNKLTKKDVAEYKKITEKFIADMNYLENMKPIIMENLKLRYKISKELKYPMRNPSSSSTDTYMNIMYETDLFTRLEAYSKVGLDQTKKYFEARNNKYSKKLNKRISEILLKYYKHVNTKF